MHGMVSMEHNGTIVLQNKIEKNQRTGKGVAFIKMKNFIHGFKFMPKMNWMQYFILSFQAKVRNQLNSDRIFREIWQTLWEFSSYPPQIFLALALHSSLGNERITHLFSKQYFLQSFLPLSSLGCHEDSVHNPLETCHFPLTSGRSCQLSLFTMKYLIQIPN